MAATVHNLKLIPTPAQAMPNPAIQTGSSFGLDMTTLGPEFDPNNLYNSERVRELQYRDSFYTATNHDHKLFDMNGRMYRPGKLSNQPLLSSAVPSVYVPLNQRRPSVPYRLPRKIVNAFTGMVFAYGKFPQYRSDDPVTQDWAQALSDAVSMEINFIRARNLGGRTGTTGISWAFVDGTPRLKVHKGQYIHVLEWEDEEEQIPAHVVELYQSKGSTPGKNGKPTWVWKRRDWTTVADIVFKPQVVSNKTPALWEVDEEQSFKHDDGVCHFVWILNLPDDDAEDSCDGSPDYAVAYEQLTELDMLNSVNTQGGIKNLDPTLVLRMDEEEVGKAVVRKGSDNAIVTGVNGDAKYMELSGSSITAGTALVQNNKNQIMEVCECVSPDPDTLAAQGTSSVALKMIYGPMLVKAGILRYQYGRAITRLITQMTEFARKLMPDPNAPEEAKHVLVPVLDEQGAPIVDEATGEPQMEPCEFYVSLPPKIIERAKLDAAGKPTEEVERTVIERQPGQGRLWLEWGPYFPPTADDDQKESGALSSACGAKPVMSQQTAVELHANAHDRDGQEEWRRVQREAAMDAQRQATVSSGMFPPIGGGNEDQDQ